MTTDSSVEMVILNHMKYVLKNGILWTSGKWQFLDMLSPRDLSCYWYSGMVPFWPRVKAQQLSQCWSVYICDITQLIINSAKYCQISKISCTKSQTLNVSPLVLQFSKCPFQWSQVISREWRCSCSNADRRCSNYIWMSNNFIAN